VKDPRLCRLLPFWEGVWREVGLDVVFVNVLRHPYAVAKSLHRRDRIPIEYGVVLWLEYILHSLSHSVGRPGIVVSFEDLIRSPLALPERLERQCRVRWQSGAAEREAIAAAFVKPGLLHHDDQLPEDSGLRDLMAFAAATYAALCPADGTMPEAAQVTALRAEWEAMRARHACELAMLRRTTNEIMTLSAECVRIGGLHSHALAVIGEKDALLSRTKERNEIIKDIAYFRFWRLLPRIARGMTGRR
jgi:hypothetical protein